MFGCKCLSRSQFGHPAPWPWACQCKRELSPCAHLPPRPVLCITGDGRAGLNNPDPLKTSRYLNKQDDLAGGQIRGLRSAVLLSLGFGVCAGQSPTYPSTNHPNHQCKMFKCRSWSCFQQYPSECHPIMSLQIPTQQQLPEELSLSLSPPQPLSQTH